MTLDDLKNFRQLGSPTAGHPERKYAPGIEATTGPLGQGIAMAVGIALGERMLAARFNDGDHEIVDHHTFTIASDGDMQEGVAVRGLLARRPPRPRPPDRLLRRQPHPAREQGRRRDHRGRRRALRGLRLARDRRRRGHGPRPPRERDARGDGRGGPAVADHRAHPHRLRQPEAGLDEGARLAARRGGDPPDQGGLRLATPTSRSTCPTRRSSTSARPAGAARSSRRSGTSATRPTKEANPDKVDAASRRSTSGRDARRLGLRSAALRGRRRRAWPPARRPAR